MNISYPQHNDMIIMFASMTYLRKKETKSNAKCLLKSIKISGVGETLELTLVLTKKESNNLMIFRAKKFLLIKNMIKVKQCPV